MRTPTIVNQPPLSLISLDNTCDPDTEHKLARVVSTARQQCLKPTFPPPTIHQASELEIDSHTSLPIPRFSSEHLARLHRGDVMLPLERGLLEYDIAVKEKIDSAETLASLKRGESLYDVVFEQRTKPVGKPLFPSPFRKNFCPDCAHLSNLRVPYVTEDHGGLTCEQYLTTLKLSNEKHIASHEEKHSIQCAYDNAQRELQREANLAREADEWQRELATWPRLVQRSPIDALQPIVRDLTSFPTNSSPTPALLHALAEANCKHGMRTDWCALCTPFVGDYLADVKASARTCFHDRLREFTFQSGQTITMCPDCTEFDNQRATVLNTGKLGKAKMQQQWEKRLEAEGLALIALLPRKHDLEAIETAKAKADAGFSLLEKRDYRASRIRKDVKKNTHAQRNCLGCGKRFVPNHASRKNCSDNCRKRHHKQTKRG